MTEAGVFQWCQLMTHFVFNKIIFFVKTSTRIEGDYPFPDIAKCVGKLNNLFGLLVICNKQSTTRAPLGKSLASFLLLRCRCNVFYFVLITPLQQFIFHLYPMLPIRFFLRRNAIVLLILF